MKKLLLIWIFFIPLFGFTQVTFKKSVDFHDTYTYILNCPDSGTIHFSKNLNPIFEETFKLLKLDKYGNEIWSKSYNGNFTVTPTGFKRTLDGGFLFEGKRGGAMFMTKVDVNGNLIWSKTIDIANSITSVQSQNSDFYFLGTFDDSENKTHCSIVKTDSLGNELWAKKYTLPSLLNYYQHISEIIKVNDNNFIIYRILKNASSNLDIVLFSIDSIGNINWTKQYGYDNNQIVLGVVQASSKEIYIVGETDLNEVNNDDLFVLKTDTNGNILSFNTYSTPYLDKLESVALGVDDQLIISGNIEDVLVGHQPFALVLDSAENIVSSFSYNNNITYFPYSQAINTLDNMVLLSSDRYLWKMNLYGEACFETFPFNFNKQTHLPTEDIIEPIILTDTINNGNYTFESILVTTLSDNSPVICIDTCSVLASITSNVNYSLCIGDSAVYTSTSINANSNSWLLDGVQIANTPSTQITFNTAGQHEVLLVSSNGSCYDTARVMINVYQQPVASFTHTESLLQVNFLNQSSDALGYLWDFGDGSSKSSLKDPQHTYNELGNYTVCLTVFNNCDTVSICNNLLLQDTMNAVFLKRYYETTGDPHSAHAITAIKDGGFVMAGEDDILNSMKVKKIDAVGNVVWSKKIGTSGYTGITSISETLDNGFIITGKEFSTYDYLHLYKLSANGEAEWIAEMPSMNLDDGLYDVVQCPDLGYIAVGKHRSNMVAVKFHSTGTVEWMHKYHSASSGRSIIETSDSNFVITGESYPTGDIIITKIDFSGNIIWTKRTGGTSIDWGNSIVEMDDKSLLITGTTISYGAGSYDMFLLSVDSLGNNLWSKTYGMAHPNAKESGGHVLKNNMNDLFVTGGGFYGTKLNYIMRTDLQGNIQWSYNYDDALIGNLGISGALCYDGGVVMSGGSSISVLKVDSNGFINCAQTNHNLLVDTSLFNAYTPVLDTVEVFPSSWSYSIGNFSLVTDTVSSICYYYPGCEPTANYSYVQANSQIQFQNTSIDATSWLWDFGDGNTSTNQNPSYMFDSTGTYYVCLIASNGCGSDTICDSVIFVCEPFQANFNYTTTATGVNFTDSSYHYPSDWLWSFGDTYSSQAQNPTRNYLSSGTYYVCLTASNACASDTFCDSVTFNCPAPTVSFIYNELNKEVTFINQSTNSTSWLWDFGNGDTSIVEDPVYQYQVAGTYLVCLTAYNSCNSTTYCNNVTVLPTSIDEIDADSQFFIYPNPNDGKFVIEKPKEVKDALSIQISDVLGKIIYSSIIDESDQFLNVDISDYSKGVYYVSIRTGEEQIVRKLIKQ